MPSKVVSQKSYSSRSNGFVYNVSLIHEDPEGPYGGFLVLELGLCDRTDTCTRSSQVISTITADDIEGLIQTLKEIKRAALLQQEAVDRLGQVLTAV